MLQRDFPTLAMFEAAPIHDVAAAVLKAAHGGSIGNMLLVADGYKDDETAPGQPVERRERARLVMGEAITYLLSQNLLAIAGVSPSGLDLQVSRLGRTIQTRQDFSSYAKGALLPADLLHPRLAKVRSMFLSGEYDAAELTAFKEVEIAVREAGPYPKDDPNKPLLGTELMREAFREQGPLASTIDVVAERQSLAHLFAGAIGYFKNPQSHRTVGLDDATVAASRILVASELLTLLDYHRAQLNT